MKRRYAMIREREIARITAHDKVKRNERPEAFRAVQLKRRYGISLDQFEQMADIQDGICALCRIKPLRDVDHCHATGRVRGLLCRGCNVGLGQLGDTVEGLLRAIEYLTPMTLMG